MSAEPSGSGIVLRPASGLPVYRQLVDQLRYLIAAGRYPAGAYLPTMRAVADELGLNLNTVNRAYRQLQRDGLVRSTQGKGALVVGSERNRPTTRPTLSTESDVESMLAAAVERALAAGIPAAAIAGKVDGILAEVATRVPAPPRVAVFAGPDWRSRGLASSLAGVDVREAVVYDSNGDLPAIVVVPRYGGWSPQLGDERVATLVTAVVADRASIAALLELEPGQKIVAVAADEAVARWLAEVASITDPSAVRWLVAPALDEKAPIDDGEIVVAESSLPGLERHPGAIAIAAVLPATLRSELAAALGR